MYDVYILQLIMHPWTINLNLKFGGYEVSSKYSDNMLRGFIDPVICLYDACILTDNPPPPLPYLILNQSELRKLLVEILFAQLT